MWLFLISLAMVKAVPKMQAVPEKPTKKPPDPELEVTLHLVEDCGGLGTASEDLDVVAKKTSKHVKVHVKHVYFSDLDDGLRDAAAKRFKWGVALRKAGRLTTTQKQFVKPHGEEDGHLLQWVSMSALVASRFK